MRQQYHSRQVGDDVLVWDVHRLVRLAADLPVHRVRLDEIRELDERYWFDAGGYAPTCRAVFEHARLIRDVDPRYPIILSSDGRVMDGMHRVGRAYLNGHETIRAVRFTTDPEPDYVNVGLDDLPY